MNYNSFDGDSTIHSSTDIHQGDPQGPFRFALGIHPLISELESKFDTWYLDDGTVAY